MWVFEYAEHKHAFDLVRPGIDPTSVFESLAVDGSDDDTEVHTAIVACLRARL